MVEELGGELKGEGVERLYLRLILKYIEIKLNRRDAKITLRI